MRPLDSSIITVSLAIASLIAK